MASDVNQKPTGAQCVCKVGTWTPPATSGSANGTFVAAHTVKMISDLSNPMDSSNIDGATREGWGFEDDVPGPIKWGVNFTMLDNRKAEHRTIASYLTVAFINKTVIGVQLSESPTTEFPLGTVYLEGPVRVMGIPREEPLKGVVNIKVTLAGAGKPNKLAYATISATGVGS